MSRSRVLWYKNLIVNRVDNQLSEGFDDSQGISPQRETIATISLFFAGENRRYTASCFPASWSWSEGRRGDSSEAMMVADTLRVLSHINNLESFHKLTCLFFQRCAGPVPAWERKFCDLNGESEFSSLSLAFYRATGIDCKMSPWGHASGCKIWHCLFAFGWECPKVRNLSGVCRHLPVPTFFIIIRKTLLITVQQVNPTTKTYGGPYLWILSQAPLPLPSSMSTIPSSLKDGHDGEEATAVLVDQDELQLVICVVGMTGS